MATTDKMLTTANFIQGESVNRLNFNLNESQKLRTLGRVSSIPLQIVHTQAKDWFNKALGRINKKTYSRLCQIMINCKS